MNSIPVYTHTIDFPETIFIDSVDGKDYYYRTGIFDQIDIRYSNQPSDYTSWTFKKIEQIQNEDPFFMIEVIPTSIYEEAKTLAENVKNKWIRD